MGQYMANTDMKGCDLLQNVQQLEQVPEIEFAMSLTILQIVLSYREPTLSVTIADSQLKL